jgi:hypothetical protein
VGVLYGVREERRDSERPLQSSKEWLLWQFPHLVDI